jgi:hypothetical protein
MYCFTAVNNRNDLKLGPFCLMLRSWLESWTICFLDDLDQSKTGHVLYWDPQ